jgi:diaminopimelate epimerase
MCGNGARCTALFLRKKRAVLETKAGLIQAQANGADIKVRLTDPRDMELDMPLQVNGRKIKVNFINTGVPHAVIFSAQLSEFDIVPLAKLVRFHDKFSPRGTNVDFIEPLSADAFSIRTYERGVEDETLACGTGSVASAIIFASKTGASGKIKVHTKSKEVLRVYFERTGVKFTNVWLEGKARIVCKGEYYV